MDHNVKTKRQLIQEVEGLCRKIAELKKSETERNQAEEALRESDDRSRRLADLAFEGIFIHNQGEVLDYNRALSQLFGFGPDEGIGKNILDFVAPPSKELVLQKMQSDYEGSYEIWVTRKDGSVFEAEVNGKPVNYKGKQARIVVLKDISERKRTEEALRQAHDELEQRVAARTEELRQANKELQAEVTERRQIEEELNRTQELLLLSQKTGKIGHFEWNIVKDTHFWSEQLEALYGLPPGGFDGTRKGWTKFIHPLDRSKVVQKVKRSLDTGEYNMEYRITWQDGSLHWIQAKGQVFYDKEGQPLRMVGVNLDITENKQMQMALQEKIKELDCLHGISTLLEVPGITLEEIIQEIVMLIPPAWQFPKITEACIVLEGKKFQTEHFRETSWMMSREIIVHGQMVGKLQVCYLEERPASDKGPFLKEERKLINAIAERIDHIIEKMKAEEALKKTEINLRLLSSRLINAQEYERKRIANELHDDLGQSLVGLKMQLSSIQNKISDSQGEIKEEIKRVIDSINLTTENVRRISKDLRPSILEHMRLLEALQWLLEDFELKYGIRVTKEIFGIKAAFSRDKEIMVFRIFQEAMTNIGKHAQATQVTVDLRKEGRSAVFSIKDNGRGFNFETVKGKSPHEIGLGLTAMDERAKMAGGEFQVISAAGKGTEITFSVPLRKTKKYTKS